uniref:Uncharacterized protein n=1 Tax=Romanomermis culicivorax TaxID=13658 RepID=A0A915JBU1_ROMCU
MNTDCHYTFYASCIAPHIQQSQIVDYTFYTPHSIQVLTGGGGVPDSRVFSGSSQLLSVVTTVAEDISFWLEKNNSCR